ncbi:MAG: GHKL domain-containing protein [Chitinophagaceae bacterium]|nr:GHKL domain-containing protein [Chitinophagaceae bacterium]
MNRIKNPKLAFVTLVYWVLLTYMIAALAWWYIALEKQNTAITNIRVNELIKDDPKYYQKILAIEEARKRKTAQYVGEGVTFLALIIIGAVFVFRATRRQLKLSQQQQNFMMAVTHELKTPIAITQLNLETLQKRKLEEDKQQKLISNTLQEARRLNSLCNNILFTSQLESGGYQLTSQEVDFTELTETTIDEYKNRFPDRILEDEIEQDLHINGDTFLLQMLLNNLLDNALKYTSKESAISVLLFQKNRQIILQVKDNGAGVPDSEKKLVFSKFYRSGNENTRKAQGTGLGLYLCKKIALAHNANISVTDNHPQGSIFAVAFNT